MAHQFTRWLRGIPVDFDTTLNLLAGEWAVARRTQQLSETRASPAATLSRSALSSSLIHGVKAFLPLMPGTN